MKTEINPFFVFSAASSGEKVRRHFRRGVQGKKGAADSPAPEFGEVDVPVPIVDTDVPEPNQLRRGIDVAVKDLHYFVP